MKSITKGTDKQIAYAKDLRMKFIETAAAIAKGTSAECFDRRIALAQIHKLEHCDDARTVIDWCTTGFHNGQPMIGHEERQLIQTGINAAIERFETVSTKPETNTLPLGRWALKRMSDEERADYEQRNEAASQWRRELDRYLRDEEQHMYTDGTDQQETEPNPSEEERDTMRNLCAQADAIQSDHDGDREELNRISHRLEDMLGTLDGRGLKWAYDNLSRGITCIIPPMIEYWYDDEAWRAFRGEYGNERNWAALTADHMRDRDSREAKRREMAARWA